MDYGKILMQSSVSDVITKAKAMVGSRASEISSLEDAFIELTGKY